MVPRAPIPTSQGASFPLNSSTDRTLLVLGAKRVERSHRSNPGCKRSAEPERESRRLAGRTGDRRTSDFRDTQSIDGLGSARLFTAAVPALEPHRYKNPASDAGSAATRSTKHPTLTRIAKIALKTTTPPAIDANCRPRVSSIARCRRESLAFWLASRSASSKRMPYRRTRGASVGFKLTVSDPQPESFHRFTKR
jgi:hypothetical protein